jgi:hypothetical protein
VHVWAVSIQVLQDTTHANITIIRSVWKLRPVHR